MASLYQLYRPQRFADLVGQEAVKTTLSQAVATGRVGHAYLFSGPKGSGKTTTARILAKAVNCLARKDGEAEPCNSCDLCRAILAGNDLDILEIDAASHRGIEEIKELREAVRFAPGKAKKKIYIIDEVHMLTREAFNALLKTLEEPPDHALFILATTEPHKVPATIKSRTQHFRFRAASVPDLVTRLEKIAGSEKISVETDALKLIAGTADGSYRNAETALEQVRSAKRKGKITTEDVTSLLGLADRQLVLDFLASVAEQDTERGMKIVQEISSLGLDVQAFLRQALDMLRAVLHFSISGREAIAVSFTEEEVEALSELAREWDRQGLVRMMGALISAGELVRVSPVPELPLEMLVAEAGGGKRQDGGRTRQVPQASSDRDQESVGTTTAVPVAKEIAKVDEDIWQSILSAVKDINTSLYALLKEAIVLGQTADGIALGVRFRFHAELLSQAKNQTLLAEAVSRALGRPAQILVEVKPEAFTKKEEELLRMAEELL